MSVGPYNGLIFVFFIPPSAGTGGHAIMKGHLRRRPSPIIVDVRHVHPHRFRCVPGVLLLEQTHSIFERPCCFQLSICESRLSR